MAGSTRGSGRSAARGAGQTQGRERWAIRGALVAVGLWLAWAIIANTASDSLVEMDPDGALAWRQNANALIRLGDTILQRDGGASHQDELRDFAEQALRTTPLESRALRLFGAAAEADGDMADADRLMNLAATRSHRDPVVQTWLFYRLSREGRFAEALGYADALLRTRPNRRDQIGPTLLAYAADAGAVPSLTVRLAANPPWREWYLTAIGREVKDPGIAYGLFDALKESGAPPTPAELRPHLDALIAAGLFEQAYLTWIHHLPTDRPRLAFAYNGDFELPVTGLPFDWSIGAVAGASTRQVSPGFGDKGSAVEVTFSGRRVAYRHLRKLMLLPPGRFRLVLEARADGLQNERGMVWRVECAGAGGQRLASTPPINGSFPWRSVSTEFEVPNENCRAQWLTLAVDARAALDQEISGEVAFDDIVVERAAAPQAEAPLKQEATP
jgi:hypothetical protein